MKTLAFSFMVLTALVGCGSQYSGLEPQKVQELVQSQNFRFVAERANPTNVEVVNIMNSLPGSTSNRVLNLDPGYGISFSKTEVKSNLPYFGRSYVAQFGSSNEVNGYYFTSKMFNVVTQQQSKKKTVLVYTFSDVQLVQKLIIEIYPNGRAYLSINSDQRQPISYDGHLAVPISESEKK